MNIETKKDKKLSKDYKFIKQRAISMTIIFIVLLAISIYCIYLSYELVGERSDFNIKALRYMVPIMMLGLAIYIYSYEGIFIPVYFRIRKDKLNNLFESKVLKNIIKIKRFYKAEFRHSKTARGTIIYNKEDNQVKKYYLFSDEHLTDKIKKDKLNDTELNITKYYKNSGYIISVKDKRQLMEKIRR